ncbi:hypothetical protein G3580_11770 [Nitrogeniibacter mangrovi]|uniref:Calcineurin-like phosphoesterase domain-containing protein n=1 Tax=Nitrogeniibacter mangrovi TaxID=2016596 RepID=A0A6C1B7N9_9RHOO|nr:hypothetical protein [Nitrogeniibacter mangrovi]QID18254.1 hypothetical protein G3580_11770 [Nitrogeniibacter mangrovi]
MNTPGRSCPLRYRYGAAAIARAPERVAEVLYVVGGLYGNLPALEALQALIAQESAPVRLCFNGDFNWFNVDATDFRRINETVLAHDALVGNVEAELQPGADDAGCGCAYPPDVDAGLVERSNRIHARLKATASAHPDLLARLATCPMLARYRVGALRIGVVHGDADRLAGWDFDAARLDDAAHRASIVPRFATADVDLFASSHTCLPVCRLIAPGRAVINNGAAGMPNFRDTGFGLVTRIARTPAPCAPLYGLTMAGTHVDALALHYDTGAWLETFARHWPPGSAAHVSYAERIRNGPAYRIEQARPS